PGGRTSVTTTEVPDGWSGGGAWGFQGGPEKNAPYAGWYHAQTTVRIAVKDKSLMDQMMKANQELVNMEVNVEDIGGRRTITAFKVLKQFILNFRLMKEACLMKDYSNKALALSAAVMLVGAVAGSAFAIEAFFERFEE